jgi:hypothetical protein
MDDHRNAFTVAFPEARKYRTAWYISAGFIVLFWILGGVILFGKISIPGWLAFTVAGIASALYVGSSIYERRTQKELALIINRRFAEEFTAHTHYDYPQDVDILMVNRSIAVRRDDGSVVLWGVKRSKDAFNVFPMI